MNLIAAAYITLNLLSLALFTMLLLFLRRIRHYPGVGTFSWLLLCAIVILLSFFSLAVSRTPEVAFFWARLRFLGLTLGPVAFLFFSLDYTEREIPHRRFVLAGLLVIPVITQIIVWSRFVIPWFFNKWSLGEYSFLTIEQSQFGIAFQIHAIQSYLLLAVAFYYLITGILNTKSDYRMSLNWILAGGILIVVGTAIPGVAGNIFPLNVGPIGISASLMTFSWGILRHHLFDMVAAAQHSVFSNLQDAVIVLNNHDEIIQYNPAAERILGDTPARQRQSIQQVLAQPCRSAALEPDTFEVTINERTFDARFSPLRLNRFHAGRILVLRDITSQKTMTEALQQSESLYRLLSDNISDMVTLSGLDGRFLYTSPSCTQASGYSSEELLAMPFEQIVALTYPPDIPLCVAFFSAVWSGQTVKPLTYRILRKDGSYYWNEVRATPIYDTTGAITHILSVRRNIDERKRIENNLRESEALYRLLAENSSDMIMLNKLDGQFVYASPSCSQQMGYADTAALLAQAEKDMTAFVYPDDLAANAEWYRRVVTGERLDSLEYRLVRQDGSVFWVEVQAQPIYDENGAVTQIMSVHRNIDERKRIQQALEESNQRFETLVRSIPAMVYQIKRTPQGEYRFEYVSPTSVKFVGHPPEAILENSALIFDQHHPQETLGLFAKSEQSAHDLTPFSWEGRIIFDGQVHWVQLESSPTRLEDGAVVWNGVHLDITAQKEAEIALEEQRQLLERVTELLPDSIYIYDLVQEAVVYANRSIGSLLGYTFTDLFQAGADHILDFAHPDDHPGNEISRDIYANLQDKEIAQKEMRWRHKDGHYVWMSLRETVYKRSAEGQVRQVLGAATDVTERKRNEEQRQQLLGQVQAANQELKDFAYIISHDLRAPLRGAYTITDWLVERYREQFDHEGQRLLDLLKGRIKRMEQMINGVLEYSRVGREEETRAAVDLNKLVAEIVQDIVPAERFTLMIETPLPILVVNPVCIRQVFQNLIDNAVKFMDKPQGEIRIGGEAGTGAWQFYVQDNGPGIAPQHFERVFQLFQTLAPKDQLESTGVGLALVKRILETHGGKVWLESDGQNGSTFYFMVPCE